jgi:hypothetical protein
MAESDVVEIPKLVRVVGPVLEVNNGEVVWRRNLSLTPTAKGLPTLPGKLVNHGLAKTLLRRAIRHTQ